MREAKPRLPTGVVPKVQCKCTSYMSVFVLPILTFTQSHSRVSVTANGLRKGRPQFDAGQRHCHSSLRQRVKNGPGVRGLL